MSLALNNWTLFTELYANPLRKKKKKKKKDLHKRKQFGLIVRERVLTVPIYSKIDAVFYSKIDAVFFSGCETRKI